jgi:hypothetical protein
VNHLFATSSAAQDLFRRYGHGHGHGHGALITIFRVPAWS